MLMRMRRAVVRRCRPEGEGGFTLVELLVSMSIFAVLLSLFMVAVTQMTKDTIRVDNTQRGQVELSRAFNILDHSLRYADSVNYPVLSVTNNWYLEYRTAAVNGATVDTCTQYRLDTTADTLAYRTWNDGTLSTLTAWRVTASRITNNPTVTADTPFTLIPAGGVYRNQSVKVFLRTQNGSAPPAQQLATTLTALNSSGDSPSNIPSTTVPVTSKVPICSGISEP